MVPGSGKLTSFDENQINRHKTKPEEHAIAHNAVELKGRVNIFDPILSITMRYPK